MDLQYFLNILLRRKWLILGVALSTAIAAYFFVDRKQDTYKATAQVSTGIVDIVGLDVQKDNPWIQQFYVDMGFGNLIEFVTSKRNVAFLTYQLLLHDLAPDKLNDDKPFRSPLLEDHDKEFVYDDMEVEVLSDILRRNVDSLRYTFPNPDLERLYKKYAEAYGYTYEGLMLYNLKVDRKGDTDLLNVDFVSESPELSTFAANTFVEDFLRNYDYVKLKQQNTSVVFNKEQKEKKKAELDSLKETRKNYQERKDIVDLQGERQATIAQIKNNEETKSDLEAKIPGLKRSIAIYEDQVAKAEKNYAGNKTDEILQSRRITQITERIDEYEKKYKESGKEQDRKLLVLLNKQKDDLLGKLVKSESTVEDRDQRQLENSLRETYIKEKQELAKAESALIEVKKELGRLNSLANTYVASETDLDLLSKEIELLEDEYEKLYGKYGDEKLELDNTTLPVQVFQHAQQPEKPEPKMKAIIAGFSGVVGGTLASVAVFLLAFFDTSLSSPLKFRQFTGIQKLLGTVNQIETKHLDWKQLFTIGDKDKSLPIFRESLRNLRHEIEHSGGKHFLFTSTQAEQGKTFLMIALAHALTVKNKRVLLVDTNFKNNTLTRITQSGIDTGALPSRIIDESDLDHNFTSQKMDTQFDIENIDIIGNHGTTLSPSEVFAGKNLPEFLSKLSYNYDYVFLEAAAMNNYSDAKELTDFVDKIVAVFAADTSLSRIDQDSIAYLKAQNEKFMGGILNRVDLKDLE